MLSEALKGVSQTENVAEFFGVSPRYLQDLFHAEGGTVSDFVWKGRLEKGRRALASGFADFGTSAVGIVPV